MTPHDDLADLEARARRRVAQKTGFLIHALVFVLVNLGLFALGRSSGDGSWAIFPFLGWGLGLAIHGLVTLVALRGDGLRARMLQREIEYLKRQSAR